MGTYQIQTEDGTYEVDVEDAPQTPQQEPSFSQGFTGGNFLAGMAAPFELAAQGAKALYDTSGVRSYLDPEGYAQTMQGYSDIDPASVAHNLGQTVSGVVPGGSTAYNLAEDVVTGNLKSTGTYTQSLGQELAGWGGASALGALTGMANKGLSNRAARRGAELEAFNDPVSQAAMRQAE
jgi:hypothetical protein